MAVGDEVIQNLTGECCIEGLSARVHCPHDVDRVDIAAVPPTTVLHPPTGDYYEARVVKVEAGSVGARALGEMHSVPAWLHEDQGSHGVYSRER